MANTCFTNYRIVGSRWKLERLYRLMCTIERERRYGVHNFYMMWRLMRVLFGKVPEGLDGRGDWGYVYLTTVEELDRCVREDCPLPDEYSEMKEGNRRHTLSRRDDEEWVLGFWFESAWCPLAEEWDAIAEWMGGVRVYFCGDEPSCDLFLYRPYPQRGWWTDLSPKYEPLDV